MKEILIVMTIETAVITYRTVQNYDENNVLDFRKYRSKIKLQIQFKNVFYLLEDSRN